MLVSLGQKSLFDFNTIMYNFQYVSVCFNAQWSRVIHDLFVYYKNLHTVWTMDFPIHVLSVGPVYILSSFCLLFITDMDPCDLKQIN